MPVWKEIRHKDTGEYFPKSAYEDRKAEAIKIFENNFEVVECFADKLPENYCIGLDGIRNEYKSLYKPTGQTDAFQDEEGNTKRQTVRARSKY